VYLVFVALSFWKDISKLLEMRTKWISRVQSPDESK